MNRTPRCGRAPLATLSVTLLLSVSSACDLQRSREESASPEEETPTWEESASAEEAAPPEPAAEPVPEPAPEPPPAPIGATDLQLGGDVLDGLWIGGPPAGFDVLLEIDGTLVTATDLTGHNEPESTLFERVDVDGAHARFRAAGAGSIVQVHALFLSRDEALVWLLDEDQGGFAVLRRVGSLPPELLGTWQAVETSGARAVRHVSLENDQLRVEESSERIYPLEATADTVDLVAVSATGTVRVRHFRRLDDEVFLSWADGGDTFVVFYRTGARPDWLPGEREPATPPTPTPPSPTAPIPPTTPPTPTSAPTGDRPLRTLSEVAWVQGADVRADLTHIARLAIEHWTREYDLGHGAFPATTEWTPASDECPLPETGSPGAGFDHATWQALGFAPSVASPYQYRFVSEVAVSFEVQARIDTDCDGVYHKLSISGLVGGETVIGPIVEDNPGE